MKGKTKLKLILIMLVIMTASLFAGCQIGPGGLEDYLAENNLTASITYYGNGGIFNNNSNMTYVQNYYHDNDAVINITTEEDSLIRFARSQYVFRHWEIARVDSNGDLVYADEAKTVIETTGEVIDLSNYIIHSNEHLKVVAVWTADVLLDYILVCDTPITVNVPDAAGVNVPTKFSNGDVIYQEAYVGTGTAYITDIAPNIAVTDATYLEYFLDEECEKTAIGQTLTKSDDGENGKIYVKYTAGLWTVVKTRDDVSSMFNGLNNSNNRYYIYNDINCTGLEKGLRSVNSNVNCTIEGNKHTISQIDFERTSLRSGDNYSIFGSFGATCKISNLTFAGLTMTTSIATGPVNLNLISGGYREGCQFENFHIANVTLDITSFPDTVIITNIPYGTSYATTSWIFGNLNGNTTGAIDADFISANSGISIANATLKIKSATIVENVAYGMQPTVTAVKMPYYINRKENT